MNIRYFLLPLVLPLVLSGCDQMQTALNPAPTGESGSKAGAEPVDTSATVATVNGNNITQNELDIYIKQRQMKGGAGQDEESDAALKELITLEVMSQEAVSLGLDRNPATVANLEQLRRSALAGAAIQNWMQSNPVSDEAIKEAYDTQVAATGKEYKARHILLETEDDAKQVIGMLDGGQDFSELAKEKSTGPSGPSGGDLGWFSAGQMVPEFSAATAELEPGSYTKTPVKTQFGWHVILLEDVRDSTPPPFDDVKERIRMVLANRSLQEHIAALRQAASIESP